MKTGLYIIGDEILSGRRQDKHFDKILAALKQRGHTLAWTALLSDDMEVLIRHFEQSFARDEFVISAGGIGGTPDDLTRHAVAAALGTGLVPHPEGVSILRNKYGDEPTSLRRRMVEFPRGATLIPNPVNQVPGFSVKQHHFVPGFPEMAWPMCEWVLDRYGSLSEDPPLEIAVRVIDTYESLVIPLMEKVMQAFPQVKVFSLPSISDNHRDVELGVRGEPELAERAFTLIEEGLAELNVKYEKINH